MVDGNNSPDFHGVLLRDWMLSILRFAVTREATDQAAVAAFAIKLDAGDGHGGITFFQRTSAALCHAILVRDREGERILGQYLRRIDHPELKRAFAAAIGIDAAGLSAKGKRSRHSSLHI